MQSGGKKTKENRADELEMRPSQQTRTHTVLGKDRTDKVRVMTHLAHITIEQPYFLACVIYPVSAISPKGRKKWERKVTAHTPERRSPS